MREVDRVEVIREVLGGRLRQGGGIGAAGDLRAAGEAAGAAVPGRGGEGAEVEAAGETGEQWDSAGVEAGDRWGGAGALRGLCTDLGVGEVDGGARVWGIGGDVAQVDGGSGAMAVEEAPGGAGSPEPAQTASAGRVGADRRFPPRLVRGSGAALHVDRVHRRRHQSADGATFCRGRDHRSLHEDLARVSRPARPPGGHLLGQAQHLPGQSKGSRRRPDPVHSDAQDPGHPAHPRQHPPGPKAAWKGPIRPSRTGW